MIEWNYNIEEGIQYSMLNGEVLLWDKTFGLKIGSYGYDANDIDGEDPDWFDDSYDDFSTGTAAVRLYPLAWCAVDVPENIIDMDYHNSPRYKLKKE